MTNANSNDAPLTQQQIDAAVLRARKQGYIHGVLVAADHFGAAVMGQPEDQTISSATEIESKRHGLLADVAKLLNDGLDELQKSHGQLAQVGDIVHAETVIATDTAALRSEAGAAPAAPIDRYAPQLDEKASTPLSGPLPREASE